MKIKKLIELLEVIEGKLPQDMYELGSYTRQNGGWVGIDDMDFIHVMRAFEKMQILLNAKTEKVKKLEQLDYNENLNENYVRKDVYEMLFDKCERLEAKLSDLRSDINAPRYAFSEVPNNMYGQSFVTAVKEYINKDRYKMRVRGQYLDHDKMQKGETWKDFEREVPLDRAKCVRIYLDEKK
tara:strand:+ start:185 stop:730 length:546 start_codon:yes stop_codon:yes gene_type:complete